MIITKIGEQYATNKNYRNKGSSECELKLRLWPHNRPQDIQILNTDITLFKDVRSY